MSLPAVDLFDYIEANTFIFSLFVSSLKVLPNRNFEQWSMAEVVVTFIGFGEFNLDILFLTKYSRASNFSLPLLCP